MGTPAITSVFNDGYIAERSSATAAIRPRWTSPGASSSASPSARPARPAAGGGRDDALLRKVAGAAALVARDPPVRPPRRAARSARHARPRARAELTPEFHGITEDDLARGARRARSASTASRTAADVVRALREVYCGAHRVRVRAPRRARTSATWLRAGDARRRAHRAADADEKKRLLRAAHRGGRARALPRPPYQGYKRFSIEGTDALVPMLDEAIDARGARAARGRS